MGWLIDWLTKNKDTIDVVVKILGYFGLTSIAGAIGWFLRRRWLKRQPTDVKNTDVVREPGRFLAMLYGTENDDSPLADHKITYRRRDPNRDIQAELREIINRNRYLLIFGPTGWGKTREAAALAQALMLEGYQIIRIRPGWLDIPKELEIDTTHSRVILFLDNLNLLFRLKAPDPRSEKEPLLRELSYHDRLLKFLDHLEALFPGDFIVIATARNEIGQIEVLDYDCKDKLWSKFEEFILPEPGHKSIQDLLNEEARKAGIHVKEEDLDNIAQNNIGGYKNAVQNLKRLSALGMELNQENYIPTLDGTWRDSYQRAVGEHPSIRYIYDAIDALREAGIDLFPALVAYTASLLWDGNIFQWVVRMRRILVSLEYLTIEKKLLPINEELLAPYDGQIEAKRTIVHWMPHRYSIGLFLFRLESNTSWKSLINYGIFLGLRGDYILAERCYSRAIKFDPQLTLVYILRGSTHYVIEDFPAALADLSKAIELDPQFAPSYYARGLTHHKLQDYPAALADFSKAIELDPKDAQAYNNRGNTHATLLNYAEALADYTKAIELDPQDASPVYNTACVYGLQLDATNACEWLRRAIVMDRQWYE